MFLIAASVALASQSINLQIVDRDGLLHQSAQIELLPENGKRLRAEGLDNGEGPDAQAHDGTWSAIFDPFSGDELLVAVVDKKGHRWTGSFELPPNTRTLRVVPATNGGLYRWRPEGTSDSPASNTPPSWAVPADQNPRSAPWGLLVWTAGLGLVSLLFFWQADPGVARGPGQALSRVHLINGKAVRHFLTERSHTGPLVIAGPPPEKMEEAVLLGPGRVDIDDLLLVLASIPGRPQVAILGELEGAGGVRGERALVQLADHLPRMADAFVVTTDT